MRLPRRLVAVVAALHAVLLLQRQRLLQQVQLEQARCDATQNRMTPSAPKT